MTVVSSGDAATGGVATGLGRILNFLVLPRQMECVCWEILGHGDHLEDCSF